MVFWTSVVSLENFTPSLIIGSLESTFVVLLALLPIETDGSASKAMVAAEEVLSFDSTNEQGMLCCESWLE